MKTVGGDKGIIVQLVMGSKTFTPVCTLGRIAAAMQKLMGILINKQTKLWFFTVGKKTTAIALKALLNSSVKLRV